MARDWTKLLTQRNSQRRYKRQIGLERLERRLVLAAGDVDLDFATSGVVDTPVTFAQSSLDYVLDSVVQSNDDILTVGRTTTGSGSCIFLARYLSNGHLDTSFGTSGRTVENVGGFGNDVQVGLQSDGRIIVAAKGDDGMLTVMRYLASGNRDTTFGIDGMATYQHDDGLEVGALIVLPSDDIVVVGSKLVSWSNFEYDRDTFAIRLLPSGLRDETFGTNGVAVFSVTVGHESASQATVQADGGIVIAGNMTPYGQGRDRTIFVARLQPTGVLDDSFGDSGLALMPFASAPDLWESSQLGLVVQESGRIVLAGTRERGFGDSDFVLIALDSSGEWDTSFGTGGLRVTPIDGVDGPGARGLIQRSDGKLLAVGQSLENSRYGILVQFNTDGSLDTGWRGTGISTLLGVLNAKGVVVQASGRAVMLHEAFDARNRFDVGLIGFSSTGFLDPTFNGTGRAQLDIVPNYSDVLTDAVAIQADGKIVVGGRCEAPVPEPWCVLRYMDDGTVDPTFGSNGMAHLGPSYVYAPSLLQLDAEGRVLVVGPGNDRSKIGIGRLNSSGNFDSTWGVNGWREIDWQVGQTYPDQALMQADGQLLVVSNDWVGGSSFLWNLRRITAEGNLDLQFGSSGFVTLGDGGGNIWIGHMYARDNGGSLIAYSKHGSSDTELMVLGLDSSGAHDPAWAGDGLLSVPHLPFGTRCHAGTFLANSDLLLACDSYTVEYFIRVDRNGQVVDSFADHGIHWSPGLVMNEHDSIIDVVGLPGHGWAAVGKSVASVSPNRFQTLVQYFQNDGSLDPTLGAGGVTRLETPSRGNFPTRVALDGAGNLVVTGAIVGTVDRNALVARFTGTGPADRPWHLTDDALNVNHDAQGLIAPVDALLVINELNGSGARQLPPLPNGVQVVARIDVNDDGFLSPVDALLVINYLNQASGGEGEAIAWLSPDGTDNELSFWPTWTDDLNIIPRRVLRSASPIIEWCIVDQVN